MASEFGLDAPELSALNLFFEYVENTPGADERYHVRGGNDQITDAIAATLPDGTIGRTLRSRRSGQAGRRELRDAVRRHR